MESTSRIGSDWDPYCEYSGYSSRSSPGWREPSPPTQNPEDPDGVPLVMDQYDPELSRKRKELQEIEERIINKKAAIAIKTVGFFKPPGVSSEMCKGETLRDRVEDILQHHPFSISSKVQFPKERIKPSIQSKDGPMQDHHPLKLRVTALLKQRCGETCVFPPNREKAPDVLLSPPSRSFTSPSNQEKNKGFEHFVSLLNKGVDTNLKDTVPDVPQVPRNSQSVTSPAKEDANKGFERFLKLLNIKEHAEVSSPSRSVAPPAKEEKSVDRGFERFLSVLNKGVDINLLSRIVNDDGEDLPHPQPPGVKSKSDPALRSESQRSGCSRTSGAESKTLSRERSSPDAKERTTDQGVDSGSQSESSLGVRKEKEKEEDEEDTPKLDEKQEQLQNILKTLGLSLGVEEMNKLTDRTQERLYGKKTEGREEKDSRAHGRSSSSSSSYSSCSSTSRSTSRSRSRSPSRRRRRSRSGDSGHKQKSERSRSREGSRDGPAHHDRKEASNEAPRHSYRDSAFPDYSLYQYSHYAASHSDRDATNPCWSYAQGGSSLPSASSNLNYPQPASEGSEAAHKWSHPHHIFSLINPDLSVSEGQSGLAPGSRCLRVVATEQQSERHLRPLTKVRRHRGGQRHLQQKRRKERKRAQRLLQKQVEYAAQRERMLASQDNEDSTEEEEKPQPTEEEVKANLRKKLQAFNQKAKHAKQLRNAHAVQPDNSLTLELS